jgi:hypothetical protein
MKTESDVRAALKVMVLATVPLIEEPRRKRRTLKAAAAVASVVVLAAAAGAIWYLR